jgi:hypothetical protein
MPSVQGGTMKAMPVAKEAAVSNIAADIVFSVLTLGVYNLFWVARQFRVVNACLKSDKYHFWPWFLLSLITFGIYGFYILYTFSLDVEAIRSKQGRPANPNFAVINLLLAAIGLHVITQAILQHEINQWFD